jgi:DNA-directed RNA polymerase subunit E'/Rpb7
LLKGTVKSQSEDGIVVDLGFIEAFIPAALTMENSYFDEEQSAWIWKYECRFLLYL